MNDDSNNPTDARDDAIAVLKRLREAGHVAYFAGGCVRDLLLGQQPKDYDVATDAPPQRVRELFRNTQSVGAAFGVILVRLHKSVIEVATFRTDLEYHDGRRPEGVRFTTAQEDARRRDFTINGLFLDPIDNRVIDYVDGQADLAAKRLRAIGNPRERFAEDYLRLLRAVRFASRLGFEIEPQTAAGIIDHAAHLPRISPERIADELRRMLTVPTRTTAWALLWDLQLLPHIFRQLPVSGQGSFDPSKTLFSGLRELPAISFGLALAVAVMDYRWQRENHPEDVRPWLNKSAVNKSVRAMRQSLKISNEESDDLEGTLNGVQILLADPEPGVAGKKRFLATGTAANSTAMLDALSRMGLHVERIQKVQTDLEELAKTEFAPTPLISGDDLTSAGAQPGPVFKRALDSAYDAQLEGRVTTRDAALKLAMEIVSTIK
jgi:poly(A) polymerase